MSIKIEQNISLAPLTSWQVGGMADHFAQPTTLGELIEVIEWNQVQKLPITVLSGGTNVLVSDQGVRGLTISLRKFSSATVEVRNDRLHIDCLSGTSKAELLKNFLKHKISPALFMAGLPGDVGGGVVMNAGVGEKITPREFVEITDWVEVLRWTESTHEIIRIEAKDLQWSYRHCNGWQPGIIVRAGISWPLEAVPDVLQQVRAANLVRAQKQPLDMPSCGSVFINPPGNSSGRLIEQSGLKGFAVGGAKVSEKHANFIVNFNKAKASDIDAVIKHVQATVENKTGVRLKTEVIYLGQWS